MDVNFLINNFDENKDILSDESAEKIKDIIEFLSNELRFKYDNLKKIISEEDFKDFVKTYIDTGKAKDKKQMISHMSAVAIQVMADKVKTDFVNLLND